MSKMKGIALIEEGLPTPEELGSKRFKALLAAHPVNGKYMTRNVLSDMDLYGSVFSGKRQQEAIVFHQRWQNRNPKCLKGREYVLMIKKGLVTVMKSRMSDAFKHWCRSVAIKKLKSLVTIPKRDKLQSISETSSKYMH